MDAAEELEQIVGRLDKLAQRGDSAEVDEPLSALRKSAERVGRAASGSWFGYHAFVYYEGLNRPPPDAHFDQEWGLMNDFSNRTSGSWVQHARETVIEAIHGRAGDPDLVPARKFDDEARESIEVCKSEISSILQTYADRDDPHLESVRSEIDDTSLVWREDAIEKFVPRSKWMSRDSLAINKGLQTPPHIYVLAEIVAIGHTRGTISRLIKLVKQAARHISRQQAVSRRKSTVGTNVFIGHGHSAAWRELKDFIEDRLGLQADEFNRVPVAGVPNTKRLEEMLSSAAIAFLVMTGEDEQHDGKSHARLNVVHEAGLFQGRLGFERAIALLEDGCEGFSNIDGLGQLRFPKGEIGSKFEEIRRVVEREGLVKAGEK